MEFELVKMEDCGMRHHPNLSILKAQIYYSIMVTFQYHLAHFVDNDQIY